MEWSILTCWSYVLPQIKKESLSFQLDRAPMYLQFHWWDICLTLMSQCWYLTLVWKGWVDTPHSSYLTPTYIYLWGYVKQNEYSNRISEYWAFETTNSRNNSINKSRCFISSEGELTYGLFVKLLTRPTYELDKQEIHLWFFFLFHFNHV